MRLSSLVIASFLIVPLTLYAQHTSGGGGSSPGGSSSGGSSASSGSGGGHAGGGSSSASAGGSHVSSGGGSPHALSPGSSPHSPGASSHGSSATSKSSAPSSSVVSANLPSSRPGAKPPVSKGAQDVAQRMHEKGSQPAKTPQPAKRGFFSFLRHPFHRQKPKPVESELRPPVCVKGKCPPCPPGETRGKNGACAAAIAQNSFVAECPHGESLIGTGCVQTDRCPPGEIWNGSVCIAPECPSFTSRAAMLANEIRMAKSQMQTACSGNAPASDCDARKQEYDGAVTRYRMLQNEAPVTCRTLLADPLSF